MHELTRIQSQLWEVEKVSTRVSQHVMPFRKVATSLFVCTQPQPQQPQ